MKQLDSTLVAVVDNGFQYGCRVQAGRRLAEIRQGRVDPQRSGERSRQDLLEKDGTVPSRIVRELARHDIAVFAIEVGRLEAVG